MLPTPNRPTRDGPTRDRPARTGAPSPGSYPFRRSTSLRFTAFALALGAALSTTVGVRPAAAQGDAADRERVLAVTEAALEAVSREDFVAFTDLMIEEALVLSAGTRDGAAVYNARDRAAERAQTFDRDIVERGFDPEVRISGPVATVWLPYDLYIDGDWSHCGVDTFTLVRTADGWRIAAMAWTVEQPPACRPHPDGPPTLPPS
jgi:ketosteroid isomerase-like protein